MSLFDSFQKFKSDSKFRRLTFWIFQFLDVPKLDRPQTTENNKKFKNTFESLRLRFLDQNNDCDVKQRNVRTNFRTEIHKIDCFCASTDFQYITTEKLFLKPKKIKSVAFG